MFKIRDRVLLGIVTGIICGMPGRLMNAIEYHLGLTDVKYGQMASSLFLPKNKVNTSEAKIVASLTNHINISLTGILVTYLLSATGRDNAVVKGAGVGSTLWIVIYGLTARLGLNIASKKPLAPLLTFVDHAIFGALSGLFVSKFGHDSLFPDSKIKEGEKLPLISAATDNNTSMPVKSRRIRKHHAR